MPIPVIRRRGALGAADRAARYHNRERRNGLYDPGLDLHQTHALDIGATVDVASVFPDRSTPITLVSAIRINTDTPAGLVWELGGSAAGAAVWVEDGAIGFAAGDGTGTGGVSVTAAIPADATGAHFRVAAAVVPGLTRVALWVDGDGVAGDDAGAMAQWADAGDGVVAAAAAGTVTPRVPVGSRGAPSGFTVVAPVRVYVGQVPRQFPGAG